MKLSSIDLFCGAGGLSCGFEQAGFEIACAIELNKYAAATYRRNHSGVRVLEKDITVVNPSECLPVGNELFCIFGGPPCQGFSESNRVTRNLDNPNNHLYRHFFRFVEILRPRWFILENVAGLRTLAGGHILRVIEEAGKGLGYSVRTMLLDAADYGVPQHRRRLFVVGNSNGLLLDTPIPSNYAGKVPHVTVADAISDLPILRSGSACDFQKYRKLYGDASAYQKAMRAKDARAKEVQGNLVSLNNRTVLNRYKYIRAGQNWEALPAELMSNYVNPKQCHTGIYFRLPWRKPSKVIGNFRKNMLIHPTQNRGISVREAARLQSFPDDYLFIGSIGFQQQQVADAVPPLLAKAIGLAIIGAERATARSTQARQRSPS